LANRLAALALLALAAAAILAGCGGGSGVQDGATVHVYVAASLCPEVQRELGGTGKVGDVQLRVLCLQNSAKDGGGVDLATQGANARRATEDSTAVAFLEASGPGAKFASPIVEGAGLAFVETDSGANGIEQVEKAIDLAGDSGSLRAELSKALARG
jgi:hypothetical protein